MLLLARAPQSEIVAAFTDLPLPAEEADMWSVGPTAASGWTAAWTEDLSTVPASWDLVLLGDGTDPRVVRVRAGAAMRRFGWRARDAALPPGTAETMATALGIPDAETGIRRALEEHLLGEMTDEEEEIALGQVAEALNGVDDALPPLENDTDTEILIARGDAEQRQDLARAFLREGGGWVLTELGEDWYCVHSPSTPSLGAGPYDLDIGDGADDQPMLTLWSGSGRGLVLQDRQGLMELLEWNSGWIEQIDDSPERARAAEALSSAFRPLASPHGLHELCRARTVAGDPLIPLLDLLAIPRSAVLVLDGDPSAPPPLEPEAVGGLRRGLRRLFGARG